MYISLQRRCLVVPCLNCNLMQEYCVEVRKVQRVINIKYKYAANTVIYCYIGYFVHEMA